MMYLDTEIILRFTETESRMVISRGPGEVGMGSYCLMGRTSVLQNKNVLKIDDGDGCKQCKCT